jgi:hypothetical protein
MRQVVHDSTPPMGPCRKGVAGKIHGAGWNSFTVNPLARMRE